MAKPREPTPPGEGERRAQRGYVPQYRASAAAIYAALERDDLLWVGVADRGAGIADDVVLGLRERVVGHQFKTSKYPQAFRLQTLLLGSEGLLPSLAAAWKALRHSFPRERTEVWLVTNDFPSSTDTLAEGADGHSAAFLREFDLNRTRTLTDWRASRWRAFIHELQNGSRLKDDGAFEAFLFGLRIISGIAADFVRTHGLLPQAQKLSEEIASLLPKLVADARDRDRWTRAELLQELGWQDSFVPRRSHHFPIGVHVQRNSATEKKLQDAIQNARSGYLALIGPPGSGKSTLLQTSLAATSGLIAVRYLAFVPGEAQGIGRGEAEAFLDDLNAQLKRTGLVGRFRDESLQERRDQFASLLSQAGERFRSAGVRTLIVVDGLDHVPREECPERSLLAELPLPAAVPEGVLILLGTQRLDLADLKPAVQEHAALPGRQVTVEPLSRQAVYRMTDAFGLDAESRAPIFDLSHGHPLVTRYLIEALRIANAERRAALLGGEITFEGDVETIYASAWRTIEDDSDARDVMGYIARAEGAIEPELLAQATSDAAVERALKSSRHLLRFEDQGWSVFHNSFRLFILSKPRLRFGQPDPQYSAAVYRRLAELAAHAGPHSPQRWLELRYAARAQNHQRVLDLAQPQRFREQLAGGRGDNDIRADIQLSFAAAKTTRDSAKVFQLLLSLDEIGRRSGALADSPAVIGALLALGDLDGAQAYAEANERGGYKIIDALLQAGKIDRARSLFERIEPLGRLLGGERNILGEEKALIKWAERVIHFREPDQIETALARLSEPRAPELLEESSASRASRLRFEIAIAAAGRCPPADVDTVIKQFRVSQEDVPHLYIEAALHAREVRDNYVVRDLLSRAANHPAFSKIHGSWRREAARLAAAVGDLAMAGAIFSGLKTPSVGALDDHLDEKAPRAIARAIIEHNELAALLGKPVSSVTPSKRSVLQPLQVHATRIGSALGRIWAGETMPSGDIVRIAREALSYLERAKSGGAAEHYAMHQLAMAAPALQSAILHAASRCGEAEFQRVVAVFDGSFVGPDGTFQNYASLRRQFVEEFYRYSGDTAGACSRLDQLLTRVRESTPEAQVEALAELAATYARVGAPTRARQLLRQLHAETLGNALAPKKDPQYVWLRELLVRANSVDPARRRERVEFVMRQLDGMMDTEGRSSAYRVASTALIEAATADPSTAFAAARRMAATGMLSWEGIVEALCVGIIRRSPDLRRAVIVTWASLGLPYAEERFSSRHEAGEIISVALALAPEREIEPLVEFLLPRIEAEGQAVVRFDLIERLASAAKERGVSHTALNNALVRWREEKPRKRGESTPERHHDVNSLEELDSHLRAEERESDYFAVTAYVRLIVTAELSAARDVFDRWPILSRDSRARFALADRAMTLGDPSFARSLLDTYNLSSDERATWGTWMGGARLQYFQSKLNVDGPPVHDIAYADFVGQLAANREQTWSVLADFDEIFPVITASPNWVAMWDMLAEQLRTSREHALGTAVERAPTEPATDRHLLAAVYRWALSLSQFEMTRHVRAGALTLAVEQDCARIFSAIPALLLEGESDELAEGLQLLLRDPSDFAREELKQRVAALVDHPDYAVSVAASRLCGRWGLAATMSTTDLPAFYRLELGDVEDQFDSPDLVDEAFGAMRVEDPMGWTHMFGRAIRAMSKVSGVSVAHIRHRARMFIEGWGGIERYGQAATDRLQAELAHIEMRVLFFRPHVRAAERAVRYVAGELRRAGKLSADDEPWLLHELGYSAVPFPTLSPSVRPSFIRRPVTDSPAWREGQERWLNDIEGDTRPLISGDDTILAEITRFTRREIGTELTMQRVRGRALEIDTESDPESWPYEFTRIVWMEGALALHPDGAETIVCRLSVSGRPEVPNDLLVMCPQWLPRLSWRSHPKNPLVYVDADGRIVAKVLWWRDGGPLDVQSELTWGEGVLVLLSPSGRAQLEKQLGPLAIEVHASRTVVAEKGSEPVNSIRRASGVD